VCIQCGVRVLKTMLWKRRVHSVVYLFLGRCFGNVVCICCGACVFKTTEKVISRARDVLQVAALSRNSTVP